MTVLTFRALESAGVETRLCNRRGYEEELIKWADVIFTAGGDGTFLGRIL